MAGGTYSLKSYSSNCWEGELGQEIWPVTFKPSERLEAGKDPAHPGFVFSPLHGVMDVWRPAKRRATLKKWRDQYQAASIVCIYTISGTHEQKIFLVEKRPHRGGPISVRGIQKRIE